MLDSSLLTFLPASAHNDPVGYVDRLRRAVANYEMTGDPRGTWHHGEWRTAQAVTGADVSHSVLLYLLCRVTPEMLLARAQENAAAQEAAE